MAQTGNRITFKQKLFAQEYVKNKGNGVQAALKVYDANYDNAKAISTQNIQKPIVQQEIQKILQKSGMTLEVVSDTLKEAVLAGLGNKATNSDSLRGIEMLLKLYNAFPEKRNLNLSYSVKEQIASKDMQEVKKLLEDLTQRSGTLLSES